MNGRVLVVDDDGDMCRLLAVTLGRQGFDVTCAASGAEALELVAGADVDAIVADVEMPGMSGIELCQQVGVSRPDLPVTILTAHADLPTAVAALRAGAYDFITKPPAGDALAAAVERAVQHHAVRQDVQRLEHDSELREDFDGILTASPTMHKVIHLLARVADADTSVVISGESGTGKELVARALHRRGPRQDGPFVAINAAAIPETLLESELFGHTRGAFTGAHADRSGLFAQAHGGTLFLDEIAELPLTLQPKLLRALQERAIRPVGGTNEVPCDVRVIAATNIDLESAVKARRFREDLFFRLNVIHLHLPPLRARGNDTLLLAQHFLRRSAARTGRQVVGLSPAAANRLLAYGWPGNVRELQNCIERAVTLARCDRIVVGDLPELVRGARRARVPAADDPGTLAPLDEIERRHILQVLDAVKGNRTVAAQRLGLDRKTLYRRLRAYRELH